MSVKRYEVNKIRIILKNEVSSFLIDRSRYITWTYLIFLFKIVKGMYIIILTIIFFFNRKNLFKKFLSIK